MKKLTTSILILGALFSAAMLAGCDDKKAQESITQLTAKLTESEKKAIALEGQVAKMDQEMEKLKSHVSHLGDVVVNLQRLNEGKGGKKKASASAHSARPATKHARALPTKKKAAKKHR